MAGGLAASNGFAGPTGWASEAGDACRWQQFLTAADTAAPPATPAAAEDRLALSSISASQPTVPEPLRPGMDGADDRAAFSAAAFTPLADQPAQGAWLERLDHSPSRPMPLADRDSPLGTLLVEDDPDLALVPLPPVVWAGLTVLGGLAITRGLRRRNVRLPV